jgi:hypothetical protein
MAISLPLRNQAADRRDRRGVPAEAAIRPSGPGDGGHGKFDADAGRYR